MLKQLFYIGGLIGVALWLIAAIDVANGIEWRDSISQGALSAFMDNLFILIIAIPFLATISLKGIIGLFLTIGCFAAAINSTPKEE